MITQTTQEKDGCERIDIQTHDGNLEVTVVVLNNSITLVVHKGTLSTNSALSVLTAHVK